MANTFLLLLSKYLELNLFYLYSICLKLLFISNHPSALGETKLDLFLLLAVRGQYSLVSWVQQPGNFVDNIIFI